jgi:hypothetical protein
MILKYDGLHVKRKERFEPVLTNIEQNFIVYDPQLISYFV